MRTIETTKKEDIFIDAYLECMRFTDCHCDSEWKEGAEVCEVFLRESIIDCLAFYSRIECYLSESQVGQAGHDFWLTRNGHGAGFWDGDWPKYGEMFTKISKGFGAADVVYEELAEAAA